MRAWRDFLKVNEWTSDYESVEKYLSHYKRLTRSEGTKELACDVLMRFCKFAGRTPEESVGLNSSDASKLVQHFVDSLADRGQSIRTVNVSLNFLKTFFRVNGFRGDKELEVERFHQPARYRKRPEYIPTQEKIERMAYSAGSVRNRAMVLALYTSGLRNSTLRAVLYGDVKDEMWKREVVKIPVYPEMKRVVSSACKGNIPYYSFISEEAVDALRKYIEQRRHLAGSVEDGEPLFASSSTNVSPEKRRQTLVKKRSLDEIVKRAAGLAGVAEWKNVYPHCLRKAFESALRNGGLDIKDQEFLMGHILSGSMDTYYDKTKVEELRKKYMRVKFFPEKGGLSEEDRKKQILDMAKVFGYSDDKIKKLEDVLARHKNVDEALEHLKKLNANSYECSRAENNMRQVKIINDAETLVKLMTDGWELVKELADDRYVIQRSFQD